MKKVIVLLAAMSLLAGSAMATIVNTKHDLSSTGPGSVKSSNYSEICVFCHTPHGADNAVALAPLWNRTLTGLTATGVYSGLALGAAASAVVSTDIDATDAPLCLSCHNGTTVSDALRNPSNLAGAQPVFAITGVLAAADLGVDFSDDHPIAFNLSSAVAEDAELQTSVFGLPTFGGEMWCSTCHDVHSDSTSPFLQMTVAGSALCLDCHIK